MRKKNIPASQNIVPNNFHWIRDPEFAPPGKGGGAEDCLTHELATPRIGELNILLEVILSNAINLSGASAGSVRLISPDNLSYPIISSVGFPDELQMEAENFPVLDCEANDVISRATQILDISICNARQTCLNFNCCFQSMISTPLESTKTSGSVLGILTLFFDTPHETASLASDTADAFSEVISAAVEHTYEVRESQRIKRLAARLAIANNIHDSLAQTLTYARMRISLLLEATRTKNIAISRKYADELDEVLEIAQKSTRELVSNFRCEMNSGGLSAALNELVTEFRKRNNIVFEYHNSIVDLELPLEYEIQTYYIIHEVLSNIARHSGATHARLFISEHFGYYVFTIEDNGIGASTFSPVEGHYGMMIMRERAHQIGGTIKFEAHPGQGTYVQFYFPEAPIDWRNTNE